MTTTKTCRDCGKTGAPNTEDWVPSKKYAEGWNSRCRDCLYIYRRKQRQAKAESLTDAELEAERQKEIERKRAYRRENRERLRAEQAVSRLRRKLPKLLAELRELTDARNARDASEAWKVWVEKQKAAAKERYGIPPDKSPYTNTEASLHYRNDVIIQWVSSVQWTLRCPKYLYGTQIDSRYAELKAQLSAFSEADIDAALISGECARVLSNAPRRYR